MFRLLLVAIGIVLVIMTVAPAHAWAGEPGATMKPEARVHLEQGLEAYADKNWERAIREFRAGYDIDPRPEFLFAWAQAERLSGDCAAAITLYEKFIDTDPSREQAQAAQKMTDRCRETVTQARPTPEPEPEPREQEQPREVVRPPTAGAAAERTWWKDGWGATLVGAGVVGLGVGAGLYVAAGSSDDAAERAATYGEFAQLKDEAAGRRTLAHVSVGVGAALVLAGSVRYFLVQRSESGAAGVAVSFTPGGAALFVRGTF